MNMRKISAILLTILIVAISLMTSACHGKTGGEAFEVPDGFDPDSSCTITFWAKNDTNKTQTTIYQNAIDSFEELYPNITVNIRLYTDYGKIYNDVITNIATDTTPNVCITYPDHIATYMTGQNIVVPLDELIADPEYGLGGSELRFQSPTQDQMVSKFMDECVIDGQQYAMPFMRSTEACYINKTYVEALGYTLPEVLTWDFIWEVSDAATAKNPDGTYILNGGNTMIPFIYKSTDNMMIQSLSQLGAEYSSEEGDILLFNDHTTEILETVATHVPNGAFSTFKISGYPANFLNAGQCVFAIDSTAGSTWMGYNAPLSDISESDLVEFETAVMTVPQYDPDNVRMISQGPSICIFNKSDSDEVMASWLFVQYLLSNDVQIPYAETEGYIPVTTLAQQDPDYIDYLSRAGENNTTFYDVKLEATQLLLDNIDNTFVTPVFNGSASLRDSAGALIENTVKSIRRGQSGGASYYEDLYDTVSAQYNLNQLGGNAGKKSDLGPMPGEAKVLLTSLSVIWILIIAYFCYDRIKHKKTN